MKMFKWRQTLDILAASFEIELRQNLTDGFVLFGILIQPLLIAFMALWMLQGKGADYGIFIVVGSGMTGLWTTLRFNGGNSITFERWTGNLEGLVGTPPPLRTVVFGKILANVTQSLLSMVGCYALVSYAFGYPLMLAKPALFIIALGFTVPAFVCFGLIIASLFILIPDFQRLQNTLEFPVYILCGFLFPIALLPGWTTPLSYLLSPYWAARALHGASSGTLEPGQIWASLGLLAVFSLAYLWLSKALYRIILYKARVDATLSTTEG